MRRRPTHPPRPPRPRPAGSGRPTGPPVGGARRGGRPAPRPGVPCTRPARPGSAGRGARTACPPRGGWPVPPAGGRWRWPGASRSGRPARPDRRRCPSSREAVATRARRSPARSRCSTMRRRAAERLPWWAATWRAASTSPPDAATAPSSAPSRRASWWATRSAIFRVLTKTSVVRCPSTCPAMRSRTSENWRAAGHRLEFAARELDGHVEVPGVPTVDDGRRGSVGIHAGEQAGHHLQGTLGGRQADALQATAPLGHQVGQPFEAEGEVGPALVTRQGVDFVDDDRVDAAAARPARTRRSAAGRATRGW